MSPEAVDRICLLIAAILPIPLILRYNLIGVLLGTLVVWVTLFVAGVLLSALGDSRGDAASMLDLLWLFFGWIGGLLYCLPIYAAKRIVILLWRAVRRAVRAPVE